MSENKFAILIFQLYLLEFSSEVRSWFKPVLRWNMAITESNPMQ